MRHFGWIIAVAGVGLVTGCGGSNGEPWDSVGEGISSPPPACGTSIGSFNGTSARSNGKYQGTTTSCGGVGSYGYDYQCVELINRYNMTHGLGARIYGNAGSGMCSGAAGLSDYVVYYPGSTVAPVPGDALEWNTSSGGPGHTALVTGRSGSTITFLQQNAGTTTSYYPTGSVSWTGSSIGWYGSGLKPACWIHAKKNGGTTTAGAPHHTDLAMFYGGGSEAELFDWHSTGASFGSAAIPWSVSSGYTLANVGDRMVSGDFNGDGRDDIATAYQYSDGTFRFHVWKGGSMSYSGGGGWYTSGHFPLSNVGARFVAGDFNGDGRDDLAMFYGSGSSASVYVWRSTGSSFVYAGIWWSVSSGYALANVGDRMVAGDFNGDGKDDIATAYQYADGTFRYHVWLSTGSSLTYQGASGWYHSGSFNLGHVGARLVAGDFNGDHRADLAMFYATGTTGAEIFRWLSNGSSFLSPVKTWVVSSGYDLSKVGNRMVAGDFNRDGHDDIATAYQYPDGTFRYHVWLDASAYQGATGWYRSGSFGLSHVGARFVAGNWDGN